MLKSSDVLETMESLAPGQRAVWQLSKTFGSAITVVTTDPAKKKDSERRFVLHLGDTLEKALATAPFMHGRPARKLSTWISDRNPVLVENPA